jgi:hypothetical protein
MTQSRPQPLEMAGKNLQLFRQTGNDVPRAHRKSVEFRALIHQPSYHLAESIIADFDASNGFGDRGFQPDRMRGFGYHLQVGEGDG